MVNRSAIVRGKGDKEREVYFNIRYDIWLKRYINSNPEIKTITSLFSAVRWEKLRESCAIEAKNSKKIKPDLEENIIKEIALNDLVMEFLEF